jgi:hypothetical protein
MTEDYPNLLFFLTIHLYQLRLTCKQLHTCC